MNAIFHSQNRRAEFLVMVLTLLYTRAGLGQSATQEVGLEVNDPRPVAAAIELLEGRHGVVITYEDPPYTDPSDLTNVAQQVRQDLERYALGAAPPVLVPRGGNLSLVYPVTRQTNQPVDLTQVLTHVCAVHAANDNPGSFTLRNDTGVLHVVPTEVRGADGKTRAVVPALDTLVELPTEQRTGLDTLQALCDAIHAAGAMRTVVGTIPMNLFLNQNLSYGCQQKPAREALVEVLAALGGGILSWQLFYEPMERYYVLNIHAVLNAPKKP